MKPGKCTSIVSIGDSLLDVFCYILLYRLWNKPVLISSVVWMENVSWVCNKSRFIKGVLRIPYYGTLHKILARVITLRLFCIYRQVFHLAPSFSHWSSDIHNFLVIWSYSILEFLMLSVAISCNDFANNEQ